MYLFIYNLETMKVVKTVMANSRIECEKKASKFGYSCDEYGWASTTFKLKF